MPFHPLPCFYPPVALLAGALPLCLGSFYAQPLQAAPLPTVDAQSTQTLPLAASFPRQNPQAPPPATTIAPSALLGQLPREVPGNTRPNLVSPPTPSLPPLPETLHPPLPSPDDLLQPSPTTPLQPELPGNVIQTVNVQRFDVVGSTVFDAEQLAALAWQAATSPEAIATLLDSNCPALPNPALASLPEPIPLTFEQLLQARSAITEHYLNCGYITSGAILPPQTPADQNNVVTIQVVEGSLEDITVVGTQRLNPGYVRSRLAIATTPPLQRQRLLQALQLLQLDPLISRVAADLQAGTRPSSNILQVNVTEADSFSTALILDNNRSPSVSTFERGIEVNQANLFGFGDGLNLTYLNTDGSNQIAANYTVPINPRNGTLNLNYQYSRSTVIEAPFDILGIQGNSSTYNLTFRQPLYQTPTEEFALGLTLSHQSSQTSLSIGDIGPFPLAPGADDEGRTRISALRFSQDWVSRSPRVVIAARSQFNLGLGVLGANTSETFPDSRFLSWLGQAQYVRQLNEAGILLLARTNMQFTGDRLLSQEQFGIGGMASVRGYRVDQLLTDNGIFASLELQYPILQVRQMQGKLFVVPFIGFGTGWNASPPNPDPSTLVGTGLGLLWRQANGGLTAELDFGIPLVSIRNQGDTWQEKGVYFSIRYSPF